VILRRPFGVIREPQSPHPEPTAGRAEGSPAAAAFVFAAATFVAQARKTPYDAGNVTDALVEPTEATVNVTVAVI